jgi:hypothetical protein
MVWHHNRRLVTIATNTNNKEVGNKPYSSNNSNIESEPKPAQINDKENIQTTSGKEHPSLRELWSNNEYWTIAAIEDELAFELSSVCIFTIDKDTGTIHIRHKYYEQAEFNLYKMNIWRPPPEFIINRSNLKSKLQFELENLYRSSPKKFEKVVTNAVQVILETINHQYFHLHNIASKIKWSFVP